MFSKVPLTLPRKLLNSVNDCGKCSENICEENNNEVKNEFDDNPDMSLSTLIISVERDIELLDQLEMKDDDPKGSAKLLSLPGYRPRASTATACPATPPPLPRKTIRHRRNNSDSTINSSYDTDELDEYFLSTPSSPLNTHIADEVTKHIIRKPTTVCCPYCLGYFFHHQELQEHLLQSHSEELYSLKNDEYHDMMPEICPCCQAEFLKPGLGHRHLVHHHPQFVCTLMLSNLPTPSQKLSTSVFPPSTPPPERHSTCICGQRYLAKNVKLLAFHLQQQHPHKFSQAMEGFFELKDHIQHQQIPVTGVTGSHYLTPHSHNNYIPERSQAHLQLLDSPFHIYESVDTPCKETGYLREEKMAMLKNNQLYETINVRETDSLTNVRLVKPKNLYESLSFTQTPQRTQNSRCFRRPLPLPLSGLETYHGVPQPEPPSVSITGLESESLLGEDDTTSLATERENYYHYSYNSDKALFRCNLCGDKFTDNSSLLIHLKTNHMAVSRALKAQYSCAKCPAKFFKNTFLLKHCLRHSVKGRM